MVGQTRKGLDAHDIGHPLRQQLRHLAAQKPPLAVLVAQRQERLGQVGDMGHGRGRVEAAAGLQCLHRGPADGLNAVGAHPGQQAGGPAGAQVVVLVALLIDALDEEVGEIGHYRLRALLLQQVD